MSVALLVSTSPSEAYDEYLPVATEGVFLSFWNPVIRELKLEWLPLFQGGIVLEREDLPLVIAEMERFIEEARQRSIAKPGYAGIVERATSLIARLRALQEEEFTEIFIG